MRFLHLGDLHLGKSLGDFDLIEDQKYILDQILAVIRDNVSGCGVNCGDVYDKAIPSEAANESSWIIFAVPFIRRRECKTS